MKRILATSALAGLGYGADADRCLALSMSGGGALGAYEAGGVYVIYQAVKDKSGLEYDVVTGVSAGAINSGAVSLFEKGKEGEMVEFLSNQWQTLTNGDVYKDWSGGLVNGVLFHSGVYDNSPLQSYLDRIFKEKGGPKRKMVVSAVDVNSGSYVLFNETEKELTRAIVSSASIPFVFPHQHWDQQGILMDGGTVWNTNLVSAVERCRELVDDDSKITVDIIVCDSHDITKLTEAKKALGNLMRFRGIKSYYDGSADILRFKQAFPKVNFRYYIEPSEALEGGLQLLDFNNATHTYEIQMVGRKDGENAVKLGEGYYFDKMEEWDSSPELKQEYPRLGDYLYQMV